MEELKEKRLWSLIEEATCVLGFKKEREEEWKSRPMNSTKALKLESEPCVQGMQVEKCVHHWGSVSSDHSERLKISKYRYSDLIPRESGD